MNIRTLFHRFRLAGLVIAACAVPVWAAQPQITAQLQPQSIRQGESAQLSVTVNYASAQNTAPQVPHVDGLDIVPVGQQSTMQIINGAVSANVTQLYQVTAQRPGSFTIPALTLPGADSSKPLTLQVGKGTGGTAHGAPAQNGPALPAPAFPQAQNDGSVDAQGKSAFLRVILPKKDLTVGELVPVEIKAYFRAGVSASLNGLPVMGSDAFALNRLSDNPEQSRESIDGTPYSVVTWTSSLAAVKAGDYSLSLDLPVLLRIREKSSGHRAGNNPFQDFFGDDSPFGNDPFFDDFFGRSVEKPMTLHTDGIMVKASPPPSADRPADFNGAVGQFDIKSELSAKNGTTGDPLTLKMIVTGYGNFDRVAFAGIPASSDWKSYKPTSHFEPGDSANTSGVKTFEQAIVPLRTGALTVPALSFSYFDSDTGKYVTKKTKPWTVQVAQGAPVAATTASTPAQTSNPVPQSSDGLAADQVVPMSGAASLRPLVLRPWFAIFNGILVLLLLMAGLFKGFFKRWLRDTGRNQHRAAEKHLDESLATMDAAVQTQDAPRFFNVARCVLKERLGAQWHLSPGQITVAEINSRLNGDGEELRSIFQTADEVTYSGRRLPAEDLRQWRAIVGRELEHITHL